MIEFKYRYDGFILGLWVLFTIILGLIYVFHLEDTFLYHTDIIVHLFFGAGLGMLLLSPIGFPLRKAVFIALAIFLLWELFEIALTFIGPLIPGIVGDYIYRIGYEPSWNRIQDFIMNCLGFFVYYKFFTSPTGPSTSTQSPS